MRIVKQGTVAPVELNCKCASCKTQFAIIKSDIKLTDDQRNGILYSVNCPGCTKQIFFSEDEYYFSFLGETADIPPPAIWQRLCDKGSENFTHEELFNFFEVFAICYKKGQEKAKLATTVSGFKGWLRSMARAKPAL